MNIYSKKCIFHRLKFHLHTWTDFSNYEYKSETSVLMLLILMVHAVNYRTKTLFLNMNTGELISASPTKSPFARQAIGHNGRKTN